MVNKLASGAEIAFQIDGYAFSAMASIKYPVQDCVDPQLSFLSRLTFRLTGNVRNRLTGNAFTSVSTGKGNALYTGRKCMLSMQKLLNA